MSDTVTIPKEKYYSLLCKELKLDLLERGGVDNWTWYHGSLTKLGVNYYDEEERLHEEMFGEGGGDE